ncbi:MAG: hypothetical protein QOI40_4420, partial [Alphaproteobacteria bacterium]|nr:hypothetical protein [Alphaproteobacteria bacterium]
RSSLIISDEPLHNETNYHTEFVVALNNQPQGGLITRAGSPDVRVARGNDGFFGFFRRRDLEPQFDNTRRRGGWSYDQRQGSRQPGWW